MNKKTLNTLLAGAVAVTTLGISATAEAMPEGTEKCYGVVKAGKNGCGSADKAHSCAGQAATDASGVEWVALPEGTCAKLAGGSVAPILHVEGDVEHEEHKAEDAMHKAH